MASGYVVSGWCSNKLRKNLSDLSFRGAQGDEESRISFSFKARFLAKFTLRSFAALRACPEQREGTVRSGGANGLGMTRFQNVFQQSVRKRGKRAASMPPPDVPAPCVLRGGLPHYEDDPTRPLLCRSRNHGQNTPLPLKFSPNAPVFSWLVVSRLLHRSSGKVRQAVFQTGRTVFPWKTSPEGTALHSCYYTPSVKPFSAPGQGLYSARQAPKGSAHLGRWAPS